MTSNKSQRGFYDLSKICRPEDLGKRYDFIGFCRFHAYFRYTSAFSSLIRPSTFRRNCSVLRLLQQIPFFVDRVCIVMYTGIIYLMQLIRKHQIPLRFWMSQGFKRESQGKQWKQTMKHLGAPESKIIIICFLTRSMCVYMYIHICIHVWQFLQQLHLSYFCFLGKGFDTFGRQEYILRNRYHP